MSNNPNTQQNTAQWYIDRLFKFTSSELYKLMTKPQSKDAALSKTAEAYVFDKIAEVITNGTCLDYNELNTKEVRWGHKFEPDARQEYERRTQTEVSLVGFIHYGDDFGGSPDGLVGEEGGIEIKCPYNSAVHARYLTMQTPEDLRKLRPEYYAQCQGNMLVTGRKWFDFVSYDPRCQNTALTLKVLRIPRDDEFIEQAKSAISKAAEYRHALTAKIVSQL